MVTGNLGTFEVGVCVRHVGWLQGTWGHLRWECVLDMWDGYRELGDI